MNWDDKPTNERALDDGAETVATGDTSRVPTDHDGSDSGAQMWPTESDDLAGQSEFHSDSNPEPFVGSGPGNEQDLASNTDTDDVETEDEDDAVAARKPSKVKTYAIVGGVLTLLASVVGTGVAIKFNQRPPVQSSQPNQRLDMATQQRVPAQLDEPQRQMPFEQEAIKRPQPEPVQTPPRQAQPIAPAQTDSFQAQEATPAQLEQVPAPPMPFVDIKALQKLVDADVLSKLDQLAESQTILAEKVADLNARLDAAEDKHKQYDEDLAALKEVAEKIKEKSLAKEPKKVSKAAPASKPSNAKKVVAPAPKPVPTVSAPRPRVNSELASARVVGVYPSVNPTLAYVVSDRGLTTVRPGDLLLGSRVLRLDGLTVVTTAGRVRPQ